MTLMPEVRNIPPITLPTRLRMAREWRELDQQDVADEMGISRATVSNYETGKTKPGKMALNAWAVATRVDVEWLKTGNENADSDNGPGDGGSTIVEMKRYRLSRGITRPNWGLSDLRVAA